MVRLIIPDWLNYDCAGCGLCCRRGWVIAVRHEDRERILARDWGCPGGELIVPAGSEYRFAVNDDGECGFLDECNRCRIHSEVGFAAKVLACQLYPLSFVRSQGGVRVGLHFSCPAVCDNHGRSLRNQKKDIEYLLSRFESETPMRALPEKGPEFRFGQAIRWENLDNLEAEFDQILSDSSTPLLRRVLWGAGLLEGLDEIYSEDVSAEVFLENLRYISGTSRENALNTGLKKTRLGIMEGVLLRMFTGLSSELAVTGLLSKKITTRMWARLRRLCMARSFFFGRSKFNLGDVHGDFADFERTSAYPLDSEAEELLARFIRARFYARLYFGAMGWGMGVLYGARFTLALYAVCVMLARLYAAARKGDGGWQVNYSDMRLAVMLADHTYGHMAGLPLPGVRHIMGVINRPQWPVRAALFATL